jgi:cytochrome c peroxidase
MMRLPFTLFLLFTSLLAAGCGPYFSPSGDDRPGTDAGLRHLLAEYEVKPVSRPLNPAAKVKLGQALFFDKILSGNLNICCYNCHLPLAATGDALSLSIGEGGSGEMAKRVPPRDERGEPVFIPRNSPDLFNRGEMQVMFWDGRVMANRDGTFITPMGQLFPEGVENALAAQAMFPVTSAEEMRGNPHENPLGALSPWKQLEIWTELMKRLLALEEYRELFQAAYPDTPPSELTFVHAANAMAAYEIDSFTLEDAPFDRYLKGDDRALSDEEKQGALLFYGRGKCAKCHSGPLLTDESFHCRLVPQIGPGKTFRHDEAWDYGRGEVTGIRKDLFCFRTPPLRNVAETGPWMHDGAYTTLEAAVRHEVNPFKGATQYDPAQLPEELRKLYRRSDTDFMLDLRWELKMVDDYESVSLTEPEIASLISFLHSLSSPVLNNLGRVIPERVPSGLPMEN